MESCFERAHPPKFAFHRMGSICIILSIRKGGVLIRCLLGITSMPILFIFQLYSIFGISRGVACYDNHVAEYTVVVQRQLKSELDSCLRHCTIPSRVHQLNMSQPVPKRLDRLLHAIHFSAERGGPNLRRSRTCMPMKEYFRICVLYRRGSQIDFH
ncbi:hypothetical protein EJ08DRAFT_218264 [Tothia fuscella]|uniref:Uncharacterized protein n=1 Tax=Tothia fuscella TaxID=1048955 RepID=A0A9P4NSR0_9PEZI|nr:hypothetical protein EJ08DRAFT_218264 [Tothia fuscella]